MLDIDVRTRDDVRKLLRRARRASIMNLGHAGAALRLAARRSIRKSKRPAPPGKPPNTRRGALRRSVLYAVEKSHQRVVIGPSFDRVGRSAMAHEFGGRYRRERYPRRPFMGPALDSLTPRLPRFWANSLR